jgi:hypothetical protein
LFPRFLRATGSGQIGPICPRRKIWETFFANTLSFPGTKIFRKKMSAQLDLSLTSTFRTRADPHIFNVFRNAQITLRILIICESYPFLFVSLFLFYICAYSTYSLYSGLIVVLTCFLFHPYCYSRCGRLSSYSLSKGRLLSTRSYSSIFHILFFYHGLLLF